MKIRSTKEFDVRVGERIREVRSMRGLSMEKVADACGITWQQHQKYEKGTNRVSASRLDQIASALGVSIPDLLPPTDLAGEALPILDDYQVKAAQIMGQIPAKQRSIAIAVLRQFVEG